MFKQDVLPFFRAWLDNPLGVAAITPSSSVLADLITSEIKPESAPVLELGPGTGVFTRALRSRGVPENELMLVEADEKFAQLLQFRFPDATILHMNAAHLRRLPFSEDGGIGAVVSGLPLLSMPPRTILLILAGAFAHLRADGHFYQFTYGFSCPVPRRILERLGLQATRIGGVLANVPPASVYRISRR
ncbi:MAG TPA: methyltransferase domain-containing protein [Alphaproteobacteria bacterium]|jgi:phospholipid N-methyltransferase